MSFYGLDEMFEGDSADMCGRKFPIMSMGGRVEGLACIEHPLINNIHIFPYISSVQKNPHTK